MPPFLRYLVGQFWFLFGSIWAFVGTIFFAVGVGAWLKGGDKTLSWLFPLIGGLFGGIGWALVVLAVRRARRALDVLMSGILVQAQVLAVEEDLSTTINGRHPRHLRYRFTSYDGLQREGSSPHLPSRLEGRWKPGDAVAVACDPQDTSRHEADIFGLREPGRPG